MSLRIAYMTGEYPRATDTFIQREVAALRSAGVVVETFSVRKPAENENVGAEQKAERAGTHYLLPACPWELFASHVRLLLRSPGRYLSALKTALFVRPAGLKALVWQLAYFAEAGLVARRVRDRQLVHLHNHFSNSSCSVAMLAAEMGGFSYSFTMHGPAEFYEPKYWRIDEKIRRARFVCCISYFCRSQAMVFCSREHWSKLHIIHCGVDPGQFGLREHVGTARQLLFIGRLAAVKGLPILLEAMAELQAGHRAFELTVIGDGPERAALEQQARDLAIAENVRFVGYQSQAQVRQRMSQTDLLAMASFAEGVPVVLMEAMAGGVPVVATQIAGIPELVQDGVSGFLVPPGDARTLARRIEELLEDAELRQRFGAAGREQVIREFNIGIEARRLVNLFQRAWAGQSTPTRPEPVDEAKAESASEPVMATAKNAETGLPADVSVA